MLYKRLLSLLLSVAMVVLAGSAIAQTKDNAGDSRDALKAQMLVVKGDEALRMDQPENAVGYYERAAKLNPNDTTIQQKLSDAREMTATSAGSSSLLNDVMNRRIVAKQMASHDIQKAINRSMELMAKPQDSKDFDTALQAAKIAQNILDQNKGYFTSEEYRAKSADINRQITWIESKRREWNAQRVKVQAAAISKQIKQRETESLAQRKKKVAELTIQVQTLRNEGKLRDALQVLDQILEIDPGNFWAQDTKYYLERRATLSETHDTMEDLEVQSMRMAASVRKAEVPWYVLIRYPKDWAELTAGRKQYTEGMADAEGDRQLREKLEMNIAKLKCPGESFEDVINFLREYSGANFYVNWRALEAAGIERTATVTLDLKNVTLRKALELLLSDVGGGATELGYVMSSGVITISTQEELNKDKQTRVYQISDLIHRTPNFIGERVKVNAIGSTLSSNSSSSGGGSSEDLFGDEEDSTETGREEANMTKGEAIQRLIDLIKSTIDPNNWRPDGEIGSISTFNGNLVITQTPDNHRRIESLIAKLRETKTIQVSVESRFIVVNTGFLSQIGVDLDFYFNLNGTQSGNYIHPINYGPGYESGVAGAGYEENYTRSTSNAVYNKGWSPIGVQNNSAPFTNLLTTSTSVPNGLGQAISGSGAGPAMAIAGTFLDDIQVDFLITATQAHQNTRNLTAPRVTLHNGQRAYVSVQRSLGYISGIEWVVSENAAAPNPEISYVPTGAMLDVDVTVSHDRRYVTMTLRPQVINLIDMRSIEVYSTNGGSSPIELPEIELQDIQTTVTIPDGGTLLIGGQKLSGEVEREMGVPVISKIPVVNRAFTNKGKIRDEQTLLILIKPKIIILDEEEDNLNNKEEDPTYMTQLN
ncbi:MAG: hypothetical protein PHT43_03225 [Anaerolineaceae bacterium]|nr:hypothetical protein [Anaerolineaceae bacterium]